MIPPSNHNTERRLPYPIQHQIAPIVVFLTKCINFHTSGPYRRRTEENVAPWAAHLRRSSNVQEWTTKFGLAPVRMSKGMPELYLLASIEEEYLVENVVANFVDGW